jgi:hypothetical protein
MDLTTRKYGKRMLTRFTSSGQTGDKLRAFMNIVISLLVPLKRIIS